MKKLISFEGEKERKKQVKEKERKKKQRKKKETNKQRKKVKETANKGERKKETHLRDDADPPPEVMEADVRDVDLVDVDLAPCGLDDAEESQGQGRLPCPRAPDDAHLEDEVGGVSLSSSCCSSAAARSVVSCDFPLLFSLLTSLSPLLSSIFVIHRNHKISFLSLS